MAELKPEKSIAILDQHKFLSGAWIGAGVVTNGEKGQVIGYRFVNEKGEVMLWSDMSRENAMILAGCLIKACHQYDEMMREGIDPEKVPTPKKGD